MKPLADINPESHHIGRIGIKEKRPKAWVIHAESVGELHARIGVVKQLDCPYEIIHVPRTKVEAEFSTYDTTGYLQRRFGPNLQNADWPDIVISSGARHNDIVRDIKRLSRNKVFTVYLNCPVRHCADYDVAVLSKHMEQPADTHNVITCIGVPHKVTPQLLEKGAEEWDAQFSCLKKPLFAVLIGGNTTEFEFTTEQAREFGKRVKEMAQKNGGSIIVTNSRRTPDKSMEAFLGEMSGVSTYFHDWKLDKGDPYFGLLALSDYLIVTGDSMSMCCEAASSGKPTYIYAPEDRTRQADKKLHKQLYEDDLARPFTEDVEKWEHRPFDATKDIAQEITERFYRRAIYPHNPACTEFVR